MFFNGVCSDSVRILQKGRRATRVSSFKGLAFSHRSLDAGEHVTIKVLESVTNFEGALRMGVSYDDPKNFQGSLQGIYKTIFGRSSVQFREFHSRQFDVASLQKCDCMKDKKITLAFNRNGEITYAINGVERGLFTKYRPTSAFWLIIDLNGVGSSIEFVDDGTKIVDNSFESNASGGGGGHNSSQSSTTEETINSNSRPNHHNSADSCSQASSFAVAPLRENLPPAYNKFKNEIVYNKGFTIIPLQFHEVSGVNILFGEESDIRNMAYRKNGEIGQGYVFLSRPIRNEEKIMIQIVQTASNYRDSLTMGITNCNPASLKSEELPLDDNQLSDRREYWVVNRNVACSPLVNDELVFWINRNGDIFMQRNNTRPSLLMNVDNTQRIWLFFDIFGSTTAIKLGGMLYKEETTTNNNDQNEISSTSSPGVRNSSDSGSPSSSSSADFTNDDAECPICMAKDADAMYKNCGHRLCYQCAFIIWRERTMCPFCQSKIVDVKKVRR